MIPAFELKDLASDCPECHGAEMVSKPGAGGGMRMATSNEHWLETNVPQGLTVFDMPAAHRRLLRTNNCLERLNSELKRRTRVASLFCNPESLLRLATVLLMETDEKWQQTNNATFPKPPTNPPPQRSHFYRQDVALSVSC